MAFRRKMIKSGHCKPQIAGKMKKMRQWLKILLYLVFAMSSAHLLREIHCKSFGDGCKILTLAYVEYSVIIILNKSGSVWSKQRIDTRPCLRG